MATDPIDPTGDYNINKTYLQNLPQQDSPSGDVFWLFLDDDGTNPFLGLTNPYDNPGPGVDTFIRLYKTRVPPGTPVMQPTEVLFTTLRNLPDSLGNAGVTGSLTSGSNVLTIGDSFFINGNLVTIATSPGNITSAANDINISAISNIGAVVEHNGALTIYNLTGGNITLMDGTGTPLETLGFTPGTYFGQPLVSIVDINQPGMVPLNPVPASNLVPLLPTPPVLMPSVTPFFVLRTRTPYNSGEKFFVHTCFEFVIPQNFRVTGTTKLFVNCHYEETGGISFDVGSTNYVTVAIYKDLTNGSVTENLISEQSQPFTSAPASYTFNVSDGGLLAGNRLYINLYHALDHWTDISGTIEYIQISSIIFSNF